jgi:hypothetical protein
LTSEFKTAYKELRKLEGEKLLFISENPQLPLNEIACAFEVIFHFSK